MAKILLFEQSQHATFPDTNKRLTTNKALETKMLFCHTHLLWMVILFVYEDDWDIHQCQMQLSFLSFCMQRNFQFNLWSKTLIINACTSAPNLYDTTCNKTS